MSVTPLPHLKKVEAYLPGDSAYPGVDRVVKLSSNESPFGACAGAKGAFRRAAGNLHQYPDSSSATLRRALGRYHQIDPAGVVVTAGSEQLINLIARVFAGPGDEIVFNQYAFIAYRIAASITGAIPVSVTETNPRALDVDAILSATGPQTRIVFLANPNNPTGLCAPFDQVQDLRRRLPSNILLVLDAAYAEYAVGQEGYNPGHTLVDAPGENCIVLRTFSKAYGLAGARIGWAHCPESLATVLHRVRNVFPVSTASQQAALAAVSDDAHLAGAVAHNGRWQPWLANALRQHGLTVFGEGVNFILARFATPECARAADEHFRRRGFIPRTLAEYDLPECLRITVGRRSHCHSVARLLGEFVSDQNHLEVRP